MSKSYIQYIILFFSIISFAQQKAKVIKIKDGDTIVVLDSLNFQRTLRLAEVDCPEKKQPFGTVAKQYTSNLVFGKNITYIQTDTDRYGRTIAKVYINNKYLSEEIIKAGMGWWYYKYSTNQYLGELQSEAKRNKIGLWVDANPIAPWNWRKK